MIGQPPDVTGITRGFRTGKGKLDPMEHKLPAAAILLGAYLKALRVTAGPAYQYLGGAS
ncbi:hypothetical protein ACH4TQ_30755 [Streptomyces sp. NPDC021218]|uniref:hypothetical protein n=1 Tax=Streptomyces sp. NPDC021218 TaxID=3365119 RepID=UPI0037A53E1A